MVKNKLIRISGDDADLLKSEVKNDFLEHHPEFEKIPLTYKKLVHEVIKYYLEN